MLVFYTWLLEENQAKGDCWAGLAANPNWGTAVKTSHHLRWTELNIMDLRYESYQKLSACVVAFLLLTCVLYEISKQYWCMYFNIIVSVISDTRIKWIFLISYYHVQTETQLLLRCHRRLFDSSHRCKLWAIVSVMNYTWAFPPVSQSVWPTMSFM